MPANSFKMGEAIGLSRENLIYVDDVHSGYLTVGAEAPFAVRGIQVDGGAEFKSVFEAECQARGLELFVLPPKRPNLNGCVERAQSTWRYEFYATYDLPHRIDKLQAFVDAFAHRSTTIGRTTRLPDEPQQSISEVSANANSRRLL